MAADNPIRLVEVFVDELDFATLAFAGGTPDTMKLIIQTFLVGVLVTAIRA